MTYSCGVELGKIRNKNKKLAASFGALLVVALGAFFQEGPDTTPILRNGHPSNIIYTRHAKCRMGCRFLDKVEVMDVIENGKINKKKSNPQARPCPVVAKEKRTQDQQMARVVYAHCQGKLKVITVIDLDTDHSCHCQ